MPFQPIALFAAIPLVFLTLGFVYAIRVGMAPEPTPGEADEEEPDPRTAWDRARKRGYWGSTIALALVYIGTSMPKVTGASDVLTRFSEWGYPENFMLFIGASEFLAGILLLIPRTSLYAASYLAIIMVGAIYTHIAFDSVILALLPSFCLSFLAFVAYEDMKRGTQAGLGKIE